VQSSVRCGGEQDPHIHDVGARLWALYRCQQRAAKIRQKPGCRAAMEMPWPLPACISREHQHQADSVYQQPPPQLGLPVPTPPFPPFPPRPSNWTFSPRAHQWCIWPSFVCQSGCLVYSPFRATVSPARSSRPLAERVLNDLDLGSSSYSPLNTPFPAGKILLPSSLDISCFSINIQVDDKLSVFLRQWLCLYYGCWLCPCCMKSGASPAPELSDQSHSLP